MYMDRDEFALLSRGGRVPRTNRAGPPALPPRPRRYRWRRLIARSRRRVDAARGVRTGAKATWTAYGQSQDR